MANHKRNINDIAGQPGRIAIVTGSSSGPGRETAVVPAFTETKLTMAVRNLRKAIRWPIRSDTNPAMHMKVQWNRTRHQSALWGKRNAC